VPVAHTGEGLRAFGKDHFTAPDRVERDLTSPNWQRLGQRKYGVAGVGPFKASGRDSGDHLHALSEIPPRGPGIRPQPGNQTRPRFASDPGLGRQAIGSRDDVTVVMVHLEFTEMPDEKLVPIKRARSCAATFTTITTITMSYRESMHVTHLHDEFS
jgi:hypothetical protein